LKNAPTTAKKEQIKIDSHQEQKKKKPKKKKKKKTEKVIEYRN